MDRNSNYGRIHNVQIKSLSARRAWIEMEVITEIRNSLRVALRKESVDRNVNLRVIDGSKSCRSPQGERG